MIVDRFDRRIDHGDRQRRSAGSRRVGLAVLTVTGRHRHLGAVRRRARLRPRRDALRQRDERRHPRRRAAPAARSRERLDAGGAGHDRQLHRDADRRRAVRRLARAAAVGRRRGLPHPDRPRDHAAALGRAAAASSAGGEASAPTAEAAVARASHSPRPTWPPRWRGAASPTPLARRSNVSAREAIVVPLARTATSARWWSSPRSSAARSRSRRRRSSSTSSTSCDVAPAAIGFVTAGIGVGALVGLDRRGVAGRAGSDAARSCSARTSSRRIGPAPGLGGARGRSSAVAAYATMAARSRSGTCRGARCASRSCPAHLFGRVLGIIRMFTWGLFPIATLLGGWVARYDLRLPFLIAAGVTLVATLVAVRLLLVGIDARRAGGVSRASGAV